MNFVKKFLWLVLGIWLISALFGGGEEALGGEFIEPEFDFDPEDFEE